MKLPTTFQELDLTGFDIEIKQYNSITKSMVDIACAVLKKNQVGIVIRSVQSALKYIYGIGGSSDTVCDLLRQWRIENMDLKRNEKSLITAILESVDDGVLDVSDIPGDYLTAMNQWAIALENLDTALCLITPYKQKSKKLTQQGLQRKTVREDPDKCCN